MAKPLLSIIISRGLFIPISTMLKTGSFAFAINSMVSNTSYQKIGSVAEITLIQNGISAVTNSVINVCAFFITYLIIRTVITTIFTLIRHKNYITRKLNRISGGIIGLLMAVIIVYVFGLSASLFTLIGFNSMASIATEIGKSTVMQMIVKLGELLIGLQS